METLIAFAVLGFIFEIVARKSKAIGSFIGVFSILFIILKFIDSGFMLGIMSFMGFLLGVYITDVLFENRTKLEL